MIRLKRLEGDDHLRRANESRRLVAEFLAPSVLPNTNFRATHGGHRKLPRPAQSQK